MSEPSHNPPTDSGTTSQALTDAIRTLLHERHPGLFSRIEGLVVREAFDIAKGNQVHAASLLGITRNEMRTLLQRYGYIAARPQKSRGLATLQA